MVMVYVAFLTCLAAVFTPLVDEPARFFAGVAVVAFGAFICADAEAQR